ncbi:MAG: efflux RND transporter permease subunit, partial [Cyanobacteria bacterium]|nr:efflux RND transporter permease subunit [Cyanobacteriota bacterium]
MNFTKIFIQRPVMTTLLMIGILLFGVIGYVKLPVSDLPNVDFPTILVSASLPGANPDTMASSVASPLEQAFSTIAGVDSMNSSSSLGNTSVTLQFNLDRKLDAAAQDVQAAIASSLRRLPPGMPSPPTLRKVNPADQPIIYIAVSSSILPLSMVDEYAEKNLAQQISMVNGVAQVSVFGSQKYATRIQLDPNAMAAKTIGLDEVVSAVQAGNVNIPTGVLYGDHKTFTVKASGQLNDAAAYQPLIVAYRNGAPVRLNDIGRVIDSVENDKNASWFKDTRSIILAVQRQPGTNTIAVINDIRKILPSFEALLPPTIHLDVLFDRSNTVRRSVNDVQFTLFLTIFLVIMVIFLFLRSLSATLISSLALPMSIVGTFGIMYLLGFSLDNISLMALTLSVGFVVDDAIVVLENITRHIEMGKGRMEAAVQGTKEIAFTVLSMTLSLVAVFIPVLFMGGIMGRLFNEFAVTITVSILVSGFVSLTLTPMLCSRLLVVQHATEKTNLIFGFFESSFQKITHLYDWSLKIAMANRMMIFLMFLSSILLTGYLYTIVPKGFIPGEDNNQLFISTEGIQGISFTEMVRHQQKLAAIVQKNPNVETFVSSVDNGNTGRIFMTLKNRSERSVSADELIQIFRPQFAKIPGINAFIQNPPSIRIGGQLSKSLYQLTLQSPNTEALYQGAQALETNMKKIPGLLDVTSDLQIKNPQYEVLIDRNKASSLGITAGQIEDTLSSAYGTRQVSLIYTPTNNYQVIVEMMPEFQKDIHALSNLYIRSANQQLIPLNAVAKLKESVGPLSISHLGQFPSVTISFNLAPGISLGDKTQEIETLASNTLPSTVRSSFQGSAQAFQSSFQGLGFLLIIAVLVIYLVLGILYESYIHPITILSGLPSAGLGALLTLLIFHKELDLYGFLGLIMLIGIVK